MNKSDRVILGKVKEAAFTNPFSPERRRVDLDISGMERSSSNDAILSQLMVEVHDRIIKYKGQVKAFSAEDLALYQYGVLFYIFHYYSQDYDDLIVQQIKEGEKPLQVTFAKEALQQLRGYGFSQQEALRYFAFFFQLRRGFYFISGIIGQSPSVKALRQALWNNIFTCDVSLYESYLWNRMEDFSTIILGETGTGKGMAAASIGRSGHIPFDPVKECFHESFSRSFISINLSQYSEHLVESELFGHAKGAFTGAISTHLGVFSRCSPHGAIFLDEIGEVSIPLQIKLLQVLQERGFSPVGSHSVEKFQGRVIAATNQPLMELRKQGKFRDDFYYRLCSDTIEVPTLKKRLDEYPQELKAILAATIKRILGVGSTALTRRLEKQIRQRVPATYSWPGNIRELEQCVRQMLLNGSYNWDPDQKVEERLTWLQQGFSQGDFTAGDLVASYCQHLYGLHGTYEKVAQIVSLDRRTVKKYIEMAA